VYWVGKEPHTGSTGRLDGNGGNVWNPWGFLLTQAPLKLTQHHLIGVPYEFGIQSSAIFRNADTMLKSTTFNTWNRFCMRPRDEMNITRSTSDML
jgi:hypothetical protein